MKTKVNMERWIFDTQMFQRIASVAETSKEDLEKEWQLFNSKQKKFNVNNAETIRVIAEEATRAAKERRN